MANVSVQQVRDLIIDRLVSGVYPHSSKLPTAALFPHNEGVAVPAPKRRRPYPEIVHAEEPAQ